MPVYGGMQVCLRKGMPVEGMCWPQQFWTCGIVASFSFKGSHGMYQVLYFLCWVYIYTYNSFFCSGKTHFCSLTPIEVP